MWFFPGHFKCYIVHKCVWMCLMSKSCVLQCSTIPQVWVESKVLWINSLLRVRQGQTWARVSKSSFCWRLVYKSISLCRTRTRIATALATKHLCHSTLDARHYLIKTTCQNNPTPLRFVMWHVGYGICWLIHTPFTYGGADLMPWPAVGLCKIGPCIGSPRLQVHDAILKPRSQCDDSDNLHSHLRSEWLKIFRPVQNSDSRACSHVLRIKELGVKADHLGDIKKRSGNRDLEEHSGRLSRIRSPIQWIPVESIRST